MNLGTFFERFDQFAGAPGAVAKMRELILSLAVQGKLVDQEIAEGDGHMLLRQLRKNSAEPISETKEPPRPPEMLPIPSAWAQSNLGEVAEIIRGVSFPGSAKSVTPSDGEVACLRTASVQEEIDWDDLIFISPNHVRRTDQWVARNDIMISMANSYALVGKVAIVRKVPQKATFGAFLAALRPILIEPFFLLYVLRSPRMQTAFRASSSQTTNIANISLGKMRPLPFPLPPPAEQRRIVAKVDELMALCDELEAQQQEREAQYAALAQASLARFADAPTPANLEFIFHPSYTITPADLRKSILALALDGRLSGQNSAEWERMPLGQVGEWGSGGTPLRTESQYYGGEIPWLVIGDLNNGVVTAASNFITEEGLANSSARLLPLGVLLIAMYGSIGKLGITGMECATNQAIAFCNPDPKRADLRYLFHLMRGIQPALLARGQGLAQKNISQKILKSWEISLPPLAEQKRIVAKVDELMALVDQLEAQLASAQETGADLVEAVVAELAGKA